MYADLYNLKHVFFHIFKNGIVKTFSIEAEWGKFQNQWFNQKDILI